MTRLAALVALALITTPFTLGGYIPPEHAGIHKDVHKPVDHFAHDGHGAHHDRGFHPTEHGGHGKEGHHHVGRQEPPPPGLKKDDVNIDVNDGRLTVSAEAKTSSERDEGGYAIRERSSGKLSRTLQLPAGIQDKDIKASLNDGILTVTFPKSAAEMPPKKITIS
ncbi:Hsp20/alpha crystallin family protein [Pectobacterium polaris]|nr:Hsp20/alpha crystallin family protein [Pectobacterium polaris]